MTAKAAVDFQGVDARLGMGEENLVRRLRVLYRVDRDPSGAHLYHLITKDGPPFEAAGTLEFRDGRLTTAQRDWKHSSDPAAFALGKALLSAIERAHGEDPANATLAAIQTARHVSPGSVDQVIEISIGGKTISLFLVDDDKYGRHVQLSERLLQVPSRPGGDSKP